MVQPRKQQQPRSHSGRSQDNTEHHERRQGSEGGESHQASGVFTASSATTTTVDPAAVAGRGANGTADACATELSSNSMLETGGTKVETIIHEDGNDQLKKKISNIGKDALDADSKHSTGATVAGRGLTALTSVLRRKPQLREVIELAYKMALTHLSQVASAPRVRELLTPPRQFLQVPQSANSETSLLSTSQSVRDNKRRRKISDAVANDNESEKGSDGESNTRLLGGGAASSSSSPGIASMLAGVALDADKLNRGVSPLPFFASLPTSISTPTVTFSSSLTKELLLKNSPEALGASLITVLAAHWDQWIDLCDRGFRPLTSALKRAGPEEWKTTSGRNNDQLRSAQPEVGRYEWEWCGGPPQSPSCPQYGAPRLVLAFSRMLSKVSNIVRRATCMKESLSAARNDEASKRLSGALPMTRGRATERAMKTTSNGIGAGLRCCWTTHVTGVVAAWLAGKLFEVLGRKATLEEPPTVEDPCYLEEVRIWEDMDEPFADLDDDDDNDGAGEGGLIGEESIGDSGCSWEGDAEAGGGSSQWGATFLDIICEGLLVTWHAYLIKPAQRRAASASGGQQTASSSKNLLVLSEHSPASTHVPGGDKRAKVLQNDDLLSPPSSTSSSWVMCELSLMVAAELVVLSGSTFGLQLIYRVLWRLWHYRPRQEHNSLNDAQLPSPHGGEADNVTTQHDSGWMKFIAGLAVRVAALRGVGSAAVALHDIVATMTADEPTSDGGDTQNVARLLSCLANSQSIGDHPEGLLGASCVPGRPDLCCGISEISEGRVANVKERHEKITSLYGDCLMSMNGFVRDLTSEGRVASDATFMWLRILITLSFTREAIGSPGPLIFLMGNPSLNVLVAGPDEHDNPSKVEKVTSGRRRRRRRRAHSSVSLSATTTTVVPLIFPAVVKSSSPEAELVAIACLAIQLNQVARSFSPIARQRFWDIFWHDSIKLAEEGHAIGFAPPGMSRQHQTCSALVQAPGPNYDDDQNSNEKRDEISQGASARSSPLAVLVLSLASDGRFGSPASQRLWQWLWQTAWDNAPPDSSSRILRAVGGGAVD